ncbi:NADP+ dependend succinate-semialdehyde dehydrogenase GabD (plasmid) [Cupriavidus necator N-1]|uniref:NADP+ dependend succinate-semialdehyde dehydrogenase GabD n=1 Tax=Cupriavidus necator (strain ATCC 43291 / DSM 13513 / CCUG 52238 / LMG 8453 / N-1) TaxID=1042878 RepID=F8GVN6_CUPNN|nr:NADP+ dependend succinate-semialdehyde dehydrogenase GabD [Cupriavidus necator N-1]
MKLKHQVLLRSQLLIAAEWRDAVSGERIIVNNPATGDAIGTVPMAGEMEAQIAVASAARALESWRAQTGKVRASILRRWSDLMLQHSVSGLPCSASTR